MGYPCKVQKIERESRNTYYLNLPTALAEGLSITKGEVFEWFVEDKNTLILKRQSPRKSTKLKNIPP